MVNYRYIVVWYNKNKEDYYYKKVKGTYAKYEKGYINQYNHEVILVIDIRELYVKKRTNIKSKVVNRLIRVLKKIE